MGLWKYALITILCLWCTVTPAQSVIVHPKTSIKNLTLQSARAIFSMRLNRWQDNTSIIVFVLPDNNPIHRRFTKEKLSMLPHQLRRSWDRYVYSGTGMGPIEVKDEQEMLEKVMNTPGAIGYTNERFINDKVRKISIQ